VVKESPQTATLKHSFLNLILQIAHVAANPFFILLHTALKIMERFHFTASPHWRFHLGKVDLVEVVVHRLSLPQSMEVERTAVCYYLYHIGEDL
jgi:hypothetical protein